MAKWGQRLCAWNAQPYEYQHQHKGRFKQHKQYKNEPYTVCECGVWTYDRRRSTFCPGCGKQRGAPGGGGKTASQFDGSNNSNNMSGVEDTAKKLLAVLATQIPTSVFEELKKQVPTSWVEQEPKKGEAFQQASKRSKEAHAKLRELHQKHQDLHNKEQKLRQQLEEVTKSKE